MTTSSSVISGKTPIGVVFDPDRNLAAALTHSEQKWATSAGGASDTDITTLSNCSSSSYTSCDTDGKSNTAKILAFGRSKGFSYPAAEYCNNYTTAGTSSGTWFLPSAHETYLLFQQAKTVNNTRTNLLGISSLAEGGYWTSTESDNSGGTSGIIRGIPWFYSYYSFTSPNSPLNNYMGKDVAQKVIAVIKYK